MDIFNADRFMLFSLILMRMSGFILLSPIFGRKDIPMLFKGGMIMVLSFMIYSFTGGEVLQSNTPIEYAFFLMKEFVIGYVLGFVMYLFDMVVTFAGSIIDYQMGLAMASIYDPNNGGQIALSGRIFQVFAVLMFFAVDGHLALVKILVTSGQVIPYGEITITSGIGLAILDLFIQCIVLAVKLAFPFIAIEFLTEAGVGILMKMIPQINVFVVNIQVKILIGLITLLFLFSPIADFIKRVNMEMIDTISGVLRLF